MELDDILSDKEPEAPPPPTEADAAQIAAEQSRIEKGQSLKREHQDKEFAARGLERDANGQWKKREEAAPAAPAAEMPPAEPAAAAQESAASPPAQPPQSDMSPKERALLAAAADERRKRQALEQQLKELQAKPAEPPKTFWEDPEGKLAAIQQQNQQAILTARLQTAEVIVRDKYPDFDLRVEQFKEYLETNPGVAPAVAQQWLSAQNPAQFAYDFAKNQEELKAAGDLPSLKAKMETDLRAKIKAELEAEYKAREEAARKQREAIPGSLSSARATGGNAVPTWGGPPSLDDILASK